MGDNVISFKAPFPRVTMAQAIKEHTGVDINGMDEEQLREAARKLGIEVDETMGKGKLIDEIFGETCEGTYIQPTFITDYPIEMSPLCSSAADMCHQPTCLCWRRVPIFHSRNTDAVRSR